MGVLNHILKVLCQSLVGPIFDKFKKNETGMCLISNKMGNKIT